MRGALRLLVVDDDARIRDLLDDGLTAAGHRVSTVSTGGAAIHLLLAERFDVVLLDLKMPDMDGLRVLQALRDADVDVDVVILTGHADVETAVTAMKLGARDYLQKPFTLTELDRVVRQTRARQLDRAADARMAHERWPAERPGLVGEDARMVALRATIEQVARSDATVLITGESGTGKELVARLLHAQSARAASPLVAVDCPSIPFPLFESELFGHERGAFTGAVRKKRGKLEDAHGATLFLDEVAELPLELQPKLLRFLQEREVVPVGANRGVHVDTRVISATNTDLAAMVERKTFRRDLFHRLAVIQVDLPPLRERPADIPLLAATFADRFGRGTGAIRTVSPDALALFLGYAWPGNVRELENVLEEACVLERGPIITPASLSPGTRHRLVSSGRGESAPLAEMDRHYILDVLDQEQWNVSRAARTLGIHRATLYRKILALGLARTKLGGGLRPSSDA